MLLIHSCCCPHPALSYSWWVPAEHSGLHSFPAKTAAPQRSGNSIWGTFLATFLGIFHCGWKNGPSFSGSPCKLDNIARSHKSTAHPLFQEHCRPSDGEYMLYFPSTKGKWSHCDYLVKKKRNAWRSSWAESFWLSRASQPHHPAACLEQTRLRQVAAQGAVQLAPMFVYLWQILNWEQLLAN